MITYLQDTQEPGKVMFWMLSCYYQLKHQLTQSIFELYLFFLKLTIIMSLNSLDLLMMILT